MNPEMKVKEIEDALRDIEKAIEEKEYWKDIEVKINNAYKIIQDFKSNMVIDSYLIRNPNYLNELEEKVERLKNDLRYLRES